MAIECPFCRRVHAAGNLSTAGLPFHRCPGCRRFFPAPDRQPRQAVAAGSSAVVAVHSESHSAAPGANDTDLPGLRPAPDLPAGFKLPTVPGYEIDRVLGRGGMGTVYLARQVSLDRPVALKVMSRRWAGDPVFVARFTREAFAAARLSHPNLVQVYDIGEANGSKFFSMEYVNGRTLSDVLRTEGKLDPETAVRCNQIASTY